MIIAEDIGGFKKGTQQGHEREPGKCHTPSLESSAIRHQEHQQVCDVTAVDHRSNDIFCVSTMQAPLEDNGKEMKKALEEIKLAQQAWQIGMTSLFDSQD